MSEKSQSFEDSSVQEKTVGTLAAIREIILSEALAVVDKTIQNMKKLSKTLEKRLNAVEQRQDNFDQRLLDINCAHEDYIKKTDASLAHIHRRIKSESNRVKKKSYYVGRWEKR
ncbi:hypothetical protein KAR48_02665 [bacterium]|nr:hypothetical protein [bacterium]